MCLKGAVRRGEGEDAEREWREILKGDNEREQESRGGEEMLQLVLTFPLACLR